ncbi:NAD-dependent epimerase/dehydratase family protein [Thermaerobacillus caldiproteolyticus]|uniref:NAD-dependent epimerase/dehydratase family protein n=1 Tax=Thermaerobacillus caldiproteolyticus TaxID=247480 RepID=UPI00188BA1D4|nr:NAD-dependent epimerase/dehydratase family protein [Anoxybacillus caldiproteolyticus]QPA31752.1 NAD-dependent epimerase/dehydratase family protein [Anoxybacillus caldiproteolyticus]
MKILVTGAAGFIGSHLCEKLLENEQNIVIGIDCLIGPTPSSLKQFNLDKLVSHPRFTLILQDLLSTNLPELLKDVDVIYHLAGMPGVRTSWGKDFESYTIHNISSTQRLLEACKGLPIQQFIYASTSSVYGEKDGKVSESMEPSPLSPYGITKLTGEHLCRVYQTNFHIPTVILRYFTVYGPRQRPDMAFHRFIKQILAEQPITIFGDGTQSRDFTYISDCVKGTAAVLGNTNIIGKTINIGGKERASVNEVIELLECLTGKKAIQHYTKTTIGEPKHTWADISTAQRYLHYSPEVALKEGLQKEIEYIRSIYKDEIK